MTPEETTENQGPKEGSADAVEPELGVNPKLLKWRWPIIITGLLLLSILLLYFSWTSFFNIVGVDDYLQSQMVAHLDTKVEKRFDTRNISLILVDENAGPAPPSGKADSGHRKYHADLIRALRLAGARVVVFDMWFDRDSPNDEELAKAIAEAEASGTKVLIGLDPRVGESQYIPRALRSVRKDRWRIIWGAGAAGTTNIQRVKLAQHVSDGSEWEPRDQPVIPSLILESAEQFIFGHRQVNYFYNPFRDQIRVRDNQGQIIESFPVDRNLYFLAEMVGSQEEGEVTFYHDVYAERENPDYLSKFNQRIVLVGYQAGDDFATPGGKRYGVEILANAVSNLLLHIYIKPLSLIYHFLIILLMSLVGALLALRFSSWMSYTYPVKLPVVDKVPIPVALLAITLVYIFVAIMAYKLGRTVFNMSYHIAALFLAYFLISAVRVRLGFKESSMEMPHAS